MKNKFTSVRLMLISLAIDVGELDQRSPNIIISYLIIVFLHVRSV